MNCLKLFYLWNSIRRLEIACNFGNGYISSLKKGTFPDDRIRIIADYLDVSVYYLMTGEVQMPGTKVSQTDCELLQMPEQLKTYALKMAQLKPDQQEHIIELIDMLAKM